MSIPNIQELCRMCLEESSEESMMFDINSDFPILEMESGTKITINDACAYINLDIKVVIEDEQKSASLENDESASEDEPKPENEEDPALPKSLCQACLEKLQSAYEFKLRCEENRNYLKEYLIDLANAKLAEEQAAKDAARAELAELHIDLDNLDALPDKLVLKPNVKKPRKQRNRDPAKPPVPRRRKVQDKDIIIAENSQVESAAYVRKIVITPEQSPELRRANKRKSKHIVIEDVLVGPSSSNDKENGVKKEKKTTMTSIDEDSSTHKDKDGNETETSKTEDPELESESEPPVDENIVTKSVRRDDDPIFEDDEDFEELIEVKSRPKRSRK